MDTRHWFNELMGRRRVSVVPLSESGAFTRIAKYLTGAKETDVKHGLGFGIVTSFNPNAKPPEVKTKDGREPGEWEVWAANMRLYTELEAELKRRGFVYFPQRGSYGTPERSVFILNISRRDLEALSNDPRWKQEAFIWGIKTARGMQFRWYENGAERTDLRRDRVQMSGLQSAEDFYSFVGQTARKTNPQKQKQRAMQGPRKYAIPFFPDEEKEERRKKRLGDRTDPEETRPVGDMRVPPVRRSDKPKPTFDQAVRRWQQGR